MKKKSLIFVLLICLIMPCCLFFTGCKDDDDGVLQLNTKYYLTGDANNLTYFVFTSPTEGYKYSKFIPYENQPAIINNFVYEYTSEDAICYAYSTDNSSISYAYTLLVSENFIVSADYTFVAENYLIENNLPYIKEAQ